MIAISSYMTPTTTTTITITSILAGAAFLVDSFNASSSDAFTSEQRDDQLAANSAAARNFIEDIDFSMINHEHRQL